jgi:hypothetical protein
LLNNYIQKVKDEDFYKSFELNTTSILISLQAGVEDEFTRVSRNWKFYANWRQLCRINKKIEALFEGLVSWERIAKITSGFKNALASLELD